MKVKANRVCIIGGYRCFRNRVVYVPDEYYDHWFTQMWIKNGYLEIIEPPATQAEVVADTTTKKSTKKAS